MFMETKMYWLSNDDQIYNDVLFGDMNGYIHITTV